MKFLQGLFKSEGTKGKAEICITYFLTASLTEAIRNAANNYKVYQNIQVPLEWKGKICTMTRDPRTVIASENIT